MSSGSSLPANATSSFAVRSQSTSTRQPKFLSSSASSAIDPSFSSTVPFTTQATPEDKAPKDKGADNNRSSEITSAESAITMSSPLSSTVSPSVGEQQTSVISHAPVPPSIPPTAATHPASSEPIHPTSSEHTSPSSLLPPLTQGHESTSDTLSSSSHTNAESAIASDATSTSSFGPSTSALHIVVIPTRTDLSTVTERPESTFSTPVFVPVTEANGRTLLSAPPLVTSIAPSTQTDGTVVQVTHVIANPDNIGNLNAFGRHSFFDNHGAVAGTFIIAGIAITAVIFTVICMFQRRRSQIHRYHRETTPPPAPFRASADSSLMSEHQPISLSSHVDSPLHPSIAHHRDITAQSANAGDSQHQINSPGHYDGPFSDFYALRQTHTHSEDADPRAPSRAQSTPSIYPPSLPGDGEDSLYEKEIRFSNPPVQHPISTSDYMPLERGVGRSLIFESHPISTTVLPVVTPRSPTTIASLSSIQTDGFDASSSGHSATRTPDTPLSECATVVVYPGEEKVIGHPMLSSPPSAFLRRQLSKRVPLDDATQPFKFV